MAIFPCQSEPEVRETESERNKMKGNIGVLI